MWQKKRLPSFQFFSLLNLIFFPYCTYSKFCTNFLKIQAMKLTLSSSKPINPHPHKPYSLARQLSFLSLLASKISICYFTHTLHKHFRFIFTSILNYFSKLIIFFIFLSKLLRFLDSFVLLLCLGQCSKLLSYIQCVHIT